MKVPEYVDPSVKKIESQFMNVGLINSTFSELVGARNGPLAGSKSKSNRRLIANLIFLPQFLKFNLHALYPNPNIDKYSGEVLRSAFGNKFSNLLYFAMMVIIYYNWIMRGVIVYFETRLNFLTDLITLEGLSDDNLKRFKTESRIVAFLSKFLNQSSVVIITVLYFAGVVRLHESIILTLINVCGTAALLIGSYICIPVVFSILAAFFLSTRYVTMRFDQNKERLHQVLRAKDLDTNKNLLKAFISTHDILSAKVMSYNEPIKFYLLVCHKIIGAASASVLYLALSGSDSILITLLMVAIGFLYGINSLACTLIAQLVHTAANDGYQELCTIGVAYNKFYDRRLRIKLLRMIETLDCPNYPVGYSCWNLFPYKNTTTAGFCTSVFVTLLLIHNTDFSK